MKRSIKDMKCPSDTIAQERDALRATLVRAYDLPDRDEAFTRRVVAEACRCPRRPVLLRAGDAAVRFFCSPVGYAVAMVIGVFLLRDRLAPTLVGFWRDLISAHVIDPQGLAFYLCAAALVATASRALVREVDR